MTFCPVGAVQDTASDVAEVIASMAVTGCGSVKSRTSTPNKCGVHALVCMFIWLMYVCILVCVCIIVLCMRVCSIINK